MCVCVCVYGEWGLYGPASFVRDDIVTPGYLFIIPFLNFCFHTTSSSSSSSCPTSSIFSFPYITSPCSSSVREGVKESLFLCCGFWFQGWTMYKKKKHWWSINDWPMIQSMIDNHWYVWSVWTSGYSLLRFVFWRFDVQNHFWGLSSSSLCVVKRNFTSL